MSVIASLLNLSSPDLIVILGIVLLLFGANKIRDVARGMGQAVRELSKTEDEVTDKSPDDSGLFRLRGREIVSSVCIALLLLAAAALINPRL